MSTNYLFAVDQSTLSRPDNTLAMNDEDVTELASLNSVALLRLLIRPSGHELSPRRTPSDLYEIKNYIIGLIPAENLRNKAGSGTPVLTNTNSVVVLPLTWNELVLQVCSQLNQAGSRRSHELIRFGAVTVNFQRMEASRSGQPVALTALQFKVLHYFVKTPGRVISREELLNKVWGYNNYPSTRTVDNIILRLRQNFEPEPANPIHFHTVHGVGYKFVP